MSQNALHIWEMSVWSVELVSAPQESDTKKHFRTQWCSMIAFKTKLALLVSTKTSLHQNDFYMHAGFRSL